MDKPIALIDMDGTLADFDKSMSAKLRELASPEELSSDTWNDGSAHIKARKRMIKQLPGFWSGLEPIPMGMHVLELIKSAGYEPHILTKGPYKIASAWTEKAQWCQKHLGDTDYTITSAKTGKGLVYGRVLFDDYPDYISSWLKHRPRGLVLMLDQVWNQGFSHPQVIRVKDLQLPKDIPTFARDRLQEFYREVDMVKYHLEDAKNR